MLLEFLFMFSNPRLPEFVWTSPVTEQNYWAPPEYKCQPWVTGTQEVLRRMYVLSHSEEEGKGVKKRRRRSWFSQEQQLNVASKGHARTEAVSDASILAFMGNSNRFPFYDQFCFTCFYSPHNKFHRKLITCCPVHLFCSENSNAKLRKVQILKCNCFFLNWCLDLGSED